MGLPDDRRVEIEFVAGTWTDVTAWANLRDGWHVQHGRRTVDELCSTGTAGHVMDNVDGRFTPGAAVLTDGSTANPFWPNVQENKRCRVSVTQGGVPYYLFTGYIDSWQAQFPGGVGTWNRVGVSASDEFKLLNRRKLRTVTEEEARARGALSYYPLSVADEGAIPADIADAIRADGAGVIVQPAFNTAARQAYTTSVKPPQLPGALSFSGSLNGGGTGSGVAALPPLILGDAFTVSVALWFATTSTATCQLFHGQDTLWIRSASTGMFPANGSAGGNDGLPLNDGQWHHLLLVATTDATNDTMSFYVDGVLRTTDTDSKVSHRDLDATILNGYAAKGMSAAKASLSGDVSYSGLVIAYADLSAYAADLYAAGRDNIAGETVADRAARILGWAGLSPADYSIDTDCSAVIGAQDTDGKTALSALQELATAEGGPLFVNGAGQVVLQSRAHRSTLTPVATFDAAADLVGDQVEISLSDEGVINQAVATVTGGPSAIAYPSDLMGDYMTDSMSASPLSPIEASVEAPWSTLAQAVDAAHALLNRKYQARLRFPKAVIDPLTASTDIWAKTLALEVGDLIRVTNLPAATSGGATQRDLFVEGVAWDIGDTTITCTLDTNPLDESLAETILDDTDTGYVTHDAGVATLSSTLTPSATTVVIATSSGPAWTTAAGSYPAVVRVGEEQILLPAAPGGAFSPQTWTGCTRGYNGTQAAAHTAGAAVDWWPIPTLAW